MKLFVYEFITAGGLFAPGRGDTWGADSIETARSLLAEGRAMAAAVIADLMAAGIEVYAMLDARLQDNVTLPCAAELVASAGAEEETFRRLVRKCDATLLIAPEIGGALLDRCRRIEGLGGRLVSPGSRCVEVAADKQATVELLSDRGVPVPRGIRLGTGVRSQESGVRSQGTVSEATSPLATHHSPLTVPSEFFPAVLKPCDGAGSRLVKRVNDRELLAKLLASSECQRALSHGNLRLEQLVPGLAASVAVLCGPAGNLPLPPCEQILGGEGFEYLGGRLPLAPPLAERAQRLAAGAVNALPSATGYVGIDLILGAATDGSEDYVIEINPRLTTSYVGLRAACRQNLAAAMLAVAFGNPAALSFDEQPLEFRADGTMIATHSTVQ